MSGTMSVAVPLDMRRENVYNELHTTRQLLLEKSS